MLKNFFLENLETVFFFYGVAFFVFGNAVLVLLSGVRSKFKIESILWLLGMFGILHGACEWSAMLLQHGQVVLFIHEGATQWPVATLKFLSYIGVFFLLSSFLFMLSFGIQSLALIKGKDKVIYCVNRLTIFLSLSSFIYFFIIGPLIINFDQKNFEWITRYFVGFPGALLAGISLIYWKNQDEIKNLDSTIVNTSFITMGIIFILYAFFAGLIVPDGSFFPASFLNYTNFINLTGFPVQIPRTLCSFLSAISIFGILKIFTLYEKAQEKESAERDALTKLYNRRTFQETYQNECERCKRFNRSLSVLFIDIDNFKQFNDKYGHSTGDLLLQAIAKTLLDNTRTFDRVFRYGGEEFLILLTETKTDVARMVAERIRQSCTQVHLGQKINDDHMPITVSIGVATFSSTSENPDKIIEFADNAMYQAKKSGKNRVSVYKD